MQEIKYVATEKHESDFRDESKLKAILGNLRTISILIEG